MHVPGALLAMAFALVTNAAPVAGDLSRQLGYGDADGEIFHYFKTMYFGETTDVVEHGPITITASCAYSVRAGTRIGVPLLV